VEHAPHDVVHAVVADHADQEPIEHFVVVFA
jgi:hypothetical protein